MPKVYSHFLRWLRHLPGENDLLDADGGDGQPNQHECAAVNANCISGIGVKKS
jgi:hypothetical protein